MRGMGSVGWYRAWSDKWLEQCSVSTFNGNYPAKTWVIFSCNLLRSYPNTNYYAQSHYEGRDTAMNLGHIEGRSTTQIKPVSQPVNTLTSMTFKWIAMGYVS